MTAVFSVDPRSIVSVAYTPLPLLRYVHDLIAHLLRERVNLAPWLLH